MLEGHIFRSCDTWETLQHDRITKLSDAEVLVELRNVMKGCNYSWRTISKKLRARNRNGYLELEHFEAGNLLYEWNVLCDEKLHWSRYGNPSFRNSGFNRVCLVNLLVIPWKALNGALKLMTSNVDVGLFGTSLAVDSEWSSRGSSIREEFRGRNGYFYAEGPEFRQEYIHERVEW